MAPYANHPSIRPADFHTLQTELVSLCITHNVNPVPSLRMSPHLQRANGMCRYTFRRTHAGKQPNLDSIEILIATRLIHEFGIERARETLRHEFAHAYCLHRYGDISHSERFKQFCASIGGSMNTHLAGTRYAEAATTDFIAPKMNWRYMCPCGVKVERRSLYPQTFLHSRSCRTCGTRLTGWTLTRLA